MYVAQMKPKLLISIGCRGKLMLDFQVARQVVRQTNEAVQFHELFGKLEASHVAWTSSSATKKKISLRCIRRTECDIEDFTKIVDEFRTKNIAYPLFVENYFNIIYTFVQNKIIQTMKKYYYEVPLLNFRRVPGPNFKL